MMVDLSHPETSFAMQFSNSAKEHLKKCIEQSHGATGIRYSLKKSGCSGLSYVVDTAIVPTETDMIYHVDDALTLYISIDSLPLLNGLFVDYVKDGFNKKLVYQNPNQKGVCGCGESFMA